MGTSFQKALRAFWVEACKGFGVHLYIYTIECRCPCGINIILQVKSVSKRHYILRYLASEYCRFYTWVVRSKLFLVSRLSNVDALAASTSLFKSNVFLDNITSCETWHPNTARILPILYMGRQKYR